MTYARSRLWLGVTGVGTWTLIAAFGIAQQWRAPVSSGFVLFDMAALAAIYVLIQAPFDWLGGYYLPGKFGRPATTLPSWAKGVAVQALFWITASSLVLLAGSRFGFAGAAAAMAISMLTLVFGQSQVAKAVGRLQTTREDDETEWIATQDPGFVGGWVGLGPSRKLIMPANWPEDCQKVQRVRRTGAVESGARSNGLLLAVCFNLAGLLVSQTLTPGAGYSGTDAYLQLVFGFTIWSFAGLLLLPSLSRPAVFAADRFATAKGIRWADAARQLDRLQDDEPARSKWVERIFHPIPALSTRLADHSVSGQGSGSGAWQGARLALYLSWSVPGLLARSVHCNVGRPDLWVLFPGD
jgi:hypothetical protein